MANPTWPAELPQLFERDGYQPPATPDGRLMTATDIGPGKVRPRTSALPRPVAGTMRMTYEQADILEAFVRDDLAKGSLPFVFPAQGAATGTWLVMIPKDGMPVPGTIRNGQLRVQIRLQIMP
jgi:hypothetical protein